MRVENFEFVRDLPTGSRTQLHLEGRSLTPRTIIVDLIDCKTIRQASDYFYQQYASDFFIFEILAAYTHWTVMLQEYAEEVPEGVWILLINWEHLLKLRQRRWVSWAAMTARPGGYEEDCFTLFITFISSLESEL